MYDMRETVMLLLQNKEERKKRCKPEQRNDIFWCQHGGTSLKAITRCKNTYLKNVYIKCPLDDKKKTMHKKIKHRSSVILKEF